MSGPLPISRGATNVRRRLLVRGIVQGVGFRPYIYRLAQRCELTGIVRNTALGALIEVEGTDSAVDAFVDALPRRRG